MIRETAPIWNQINIISVAVYFIHGKVIPNRLFDTRYQQFNSPHFPDVYCLGPGCEYSASKSVNSASLWSKAVGSDKTYSVWFNLQHQLFGNIIDTYARKRYMKGFAVTETTVDYNGDCAVQKFKMIKQMEWLLCMNEFRYIPLVVNRLSQDSSAFIPFFRNLSLWNVTQRTPVILPCDVQNCKIT